MNTGYRIKCPSSMLSRRERIDAIVGEFQNWITSDSFINLIRVFGGDIKIYQNATSIEIIRWLKSFVAIWDYRKNQASALTKDGEAARWLLKNDAFIVENKDLIYQSAAELGLIGIRASLYNVADYVLPLGGARLSNLRRCEIARETLDGINGTPTVVALSGMRPIADSERIGYIDAYAPTAKTEFDAMSSGLCMAFGIKDDYTDDISECENPNLSSLIRHFSEKYRGSDLFAIAAPSTVATRRANSADCFRFFFEKFAVPEHSKIINCTSQIYCPYQQVRALTFAVEHNVEFDTIGFPFAMNTIEPSTGANQLSEPVNYLQEIKGTIDAMNDFLDQFLDG